MKKAFPKKTGLFACPNLLFNLSWVGKMISGTRFIENRMPNIMQN
jgi:hypothetical protein